MDEKIVEFPGTTVLEVPVDRVLMGAVDNNLSKVLVIGLNENDDIYVAASTGKAETLVFLLELAKFELFGRLER